MKKNKKVVHWIGWFKFWYPVCFSSVVDKRMDIEETHTWGYKTACGEPLWPKWEGSTNIKNVTCKRCKKVYGE
jgi:hypothetical protein